MSIRLSADSGQILGKLQRSLHLPERPPLLHLALAEGLLLASQRIDLTQVDSRGPEIPLKVITAGQDLLIDSLFIEVIETYSCTESERRKYFKILLDIGLQKLFEHFEKMDNSSDFLVQLARRSLQDISSS